MSSSSCPVVRDDYAAGGAIEPRIGNHGRDGIHLAAIIERTAGDLVLCSASSDVEHDYGGPDPLVGDQLERDGVAFPEPERLLVVARSGKRYHDCEPDAVVFFEQLAAKLVIYTTTDYSARVKRNKHFLPAALRLDLHACICLFRILLRSRVVLLLLPSFLVAILFRRFLRRTFLVHSFQLGGRFFTSSVVDFWRRRQLLLGFASARGLIVRDLFCWLVIKFCTDVLLRPAGLFFLLFRSLQLPALRLVFSRGANVVIYTGPGRIVHHSFFHNNSRT
ncbi:hypothetical protein JCM8202v2_003365 [Rhodotorula sphaerocarpa]